MHKGMLYQEIDFCDLRMPVSSGKLWYAVDQDFGTITDPATLPPDSPRSEEETWLKISEMHRLLYGAFICQDLHVYRLVKHALCPILIQAKNH
jgi:hypothetical protein